MTVKKLAIPGIFLLCSGLVASQTSTQEPDYHSTSGNSFARLCSALDIEKTHLDMQHTVACMAFVDGVVQGVYEEVSLTQTAANQEPFLPFCLPEEAETGQLVKVVLKYIHNHPELAHQRTAALIVKALREAYSCKK